MYYYWDQKLMREQLDQKLTKLKDLGTFNVGWIKMLREALGLSASQLAKKVGIDQSRISRLEKAEVSGDLKLSSLKKIAEALDMHFVYGFVPKKDLESMVRDQARKIALERMKKIDHTMRLEQQELSEKHKSYAIETMIDKILLEEPKTLWD